MKNIIPANVISRMQDFKERAETEQAKFQTSFARNPIQALEGVDSQFDQAARLEMAIRTLDLIAYGEGRGFDDAAIMAEVNRFAMREFLRFSGLNTNHSTSQGTNLMDGARVAAYSDLVGWLQDF